MASYDYLMTEQPWLFRSEFADAWSEPGRFFKSEEMTTPVHTPTVSTASENEVFVSKHSRSLAPLAGGVGKRKPRRASKRTATTTFITADPANFRQMVQQVTGVRFDGVGESEQLPAANEGGGLMPTLDTSAFLLSTSQPAVVAEDYGGAAAAEGYFGSSSFCSFPTLESWRAV